MSVSNSNSKTRINDQEERVGPRTVSQCAYKKGQSTQCQKEVIEGSKWCGNHQSQKETYNCCLHYFVAKQNVRFKNTNTRTIVRCYHPAGSRGFCNVHTPMFATVVMKEEYWKPCNAQNHHGLIRTKGQVSSDPGALLGNDLADESQHWCNVCKEKAEQGNMLGVIVI